MIGKYLSFICVSLTLLSCLVVGSNGQEMEPLGPDLSMYYITVENLENLVEGDKVTVTILFSNYGNEMVPSGWKLQVRENGKLIKETLIDFDLDPSENGHYNFTMECKFGTRELEVTLDSGNIITETDEENNQFKTQFTVERGEPFFKWYFVLICICIPAVFIPLVIIAIVIIFLIRSKKST